jgi:hypothetical protein
MRGSLCCSAIGVTVHLQAKYTDQDAESALILESYCTVLHLQEAGEERSQAGGRHQQTHATHTEFACCQHS